eukprot:scaffold132378_cov43-Prasinocladus_malaysianus.AAC.1
MARKPRGPRARKQCPLCSKFFRCDGIKKHFLTVHKEVPEADIPNASGLRDEVPLGQTTLSFANVSSAPAQSQSEGATVTDGRDQTGALDTQNNGPSVPVPAETASGPGLGEGGVDDPGTKFTDIGRAFVLNIQNETRSTEEMIRDLEGNPYFGGAIEPGLVELLSTFADIVAMQFNVLQRTYADATVEEIRKALRRIEEALPGAENGSNNTVGVQERRYTNMDDLLHDCGFHKEEDEGVGVVVCPKCTKYLGKRYSLKIGEMRRNRASWVAHLNSTIHKKACEFEGQIDEEERKTREIGENLARLVLQTIREAGSYQAFERKIVDFYLMGGRVGRFNHSSKFMRGMVQAMYDLTCRRVKRWLHSIDPLTGKPRLYSATADKVTEQHRTGQAIGILAFDDGEVKALFVDYLLSKDATGAGLTKDLMSLCLQDTFGFTRDQLLQQFMGFAADGQYFNLNVMEEIAKALLPMEEQENESKISELMKWLLCTWDGAHRLELSIGDVRSDKQSVLGQIADRQPRKKKQPREERLNSVKWYQDLSGKVAEIYHGFNYGKGYETLLDIAEEHEVKLYALKRVCDTRFAQSEHRVYENFIKNYKVLREALRKKSKDKKGQTKQERKPPHYRSRSCMFMMLPVPTANPCNARNFQNGLRKEWLKVFFTRPLAIGRGKKK